MKKATLRLSAALLVCALLIADPCAAYVGPGAGISLLGALWAVILAVVFAIGGLLIWPIRRLLRRRKAAATEKSETAEMNAGGDTREKS